MTKKELMTALRTLRDDIRCTPMRYPVDARRREDWGNTVAELARQLAMDVEDDVPRPEGEKS